MLSSAYYFLVLTCCATTALAHKSYDGYQVIRTRELRAEDEVENVLSLTEQNDYDFLTSPRVGSAVQILVGPEKTDALQSNLRTLGLFPEVLVQNVERALSLERKTYSSMKRRSRKSVSSDRYLNFDEIMAYVKTVAEMFPEIATIIDIGTSWEGRPMRLLKLSNGPGKNAVFMDSAIHAREWLGPLTLIHFIDQLTKNLQENQALLDANDWFFLLVANPDGYVYSWSEDRFWRKTRKPNNGSDCIGTDPNRNFDYLWKEANDDVCTQHYSGSEPFSEPECAAISKFILENTKITLYLAMHSYGQLILLPWVVEKNQTVSSDNKLESVAKEAQRALAAVNGTQYSVGTTTQVLGYVAHGTSFDWAFAKAGIQLSYTMELSPKWNGQVVEANFILDPARIPVVKAESWEAVKVFVSHLPETRVNV
ncbi:Hypothetical predicted protein [Cloeon dipterum]|uniref:Peptidase M14 domain-containing protein n=1 Tax=Cloeon dipterum TaxID=197152 RepID=A0A8S1DG96_9INSE|nr:Hypothetical predicted protein [Cloeon dipterum]